MDESQIVHLAGLTKDSPLRGKADQRGATFSAGGSSFGKRCGTKPVRICCLRIFVFGTAFLAFGGCSRRVLLELTFLAVFRFGVFKHCLREGSHIGGREPCLRSFPLKVASMSDKSCVSSFGGTLGDPFS